LVASVGNLFVILTNVCNSLPDHVASPTISPLYLIFIDVRIYASKETRLEVKFVFKIIDKYNNNEAPSKHLAFITGKELFNCLTDY
jgi:hypothetical protein